MSPIRIPPVPSIPKGIVSQTDIGGGLTLKANRHNIPLNQMRILKNCTLIEDGSLIGRRGTLLRNASPIGTGTVLGATRAILTSNLWLAVGNNGTVYQSTDGTTFTSSLAGLTAGSAAWFVQYLAFTYLSTKSDAPKKFDGTTWTTMGLAAPGGAPSGAAGAAGTPNGTYTLEYTFSSGTLESNPSPVSGSITVTNQQIAATGIGVSSDPQVTKRTLYGFKNAVSSTYQKIADINDNTTTTYTVTTDQNSWTVAPPLDHNPPVTGAWLTAEFKNRFWKAGDPAFPNRLYFSQIFLPEAWPASFFVDIPFEGGAAITALFVLGDLLLVFGDNAVYYLFGDTPFSFVVKQSFAQSGCPSPWAIDRVQNACFFLSRFGVYAFDGAQATLLSDSIDPQFTGIFPQFVSMNYQSAITATMKYYDRLKALVLSFPSAVANDTTYWYFLRRQGWVQDTRAARLFLVDDAATGQGNLYAWDAAAGSFRQWDIGFNDDGTAITAEWKTGSLQGDNPLGAKVWNWLTVRAQPANATITVTATLDGGVAVDTFTIPLMRGSAYGSAIYGTSVYGAAFDNLDEFDERFDANMKGRAIEIDCSVTYLEFVRFAGMLTTYTPLPVVRRRVGDIPANI